MRYFVGDCGFWVVGEGEERVITNYGLRIMESASVCDKATTRQAACGESDGWVGIMDYRDVYEDLRKKMN
jgi:hypothetical protein